MDIRNTVSQTGNLMSPKPAEESLTFLQRFILLVVHASGSQPSILPLPPNLRPLSLVMSRDNTYVAVGYGSSIHLYQYQGSTKVWGVSIHITEFRTSQDVKYQILSFSPDSRYMVVATQKYDKFKGRDDDTVWVRVWRCEENPGEGTSMGVCQMPTVSHNIFIVVTPRGFTLVLTL